MVESCCVPGCKSIYKKKVCMHGFPKGDEALIQQWIKATSRKNWYPTKSSKICGDHFVASDYLSVNSHRLKPTAVPSLLLPSVKETQNEENPIMQTTVETTPLPLPLPHFLIVYDSGDNPMEGTSNQGIIAPTAIPSLPLPLPVIVECCHEDEENPLENPLENPIQINEDMMNGMQTMNNDVESHIFASEDRKHAIPMPVHMGFRKRPRVATLSEILANKAKASPSPSPQIDIETELPMSTIFNRSKTKKNINLESSFQPIETEPQMSTIYNRSKTKKNINLESSFQPIEKEHPMSTIYNRSKTKKNINLESSFQPIDTEPPMSTVYNWSKTKKHTNLESSFQFNSNSNSNSNNSNSISYNSSGSGNECNYSPSETASNILEKDDEDVELLAVKLINLCIGKNPKMYVGINKVWHENGFVDLLSQKSNLPMRDLNVTLMKLRLNDSFERLGHMFGISERMANIIFNNTVNHLSKFLKEVVCWPNDYTILKLLPIPFRCKFSNVKCLINCLEIETGKPTDKKQLTFTWCALTRRNILKYLVASTPDGYINFVSKGFGGSHTDTEMVEQCSRFIDLLPDGCAILAERRFENILSVIKNKSCELIILPTVTKKCKCTMEEILFNKSIMSLRIHFDKVLRLMREYEILEPRSALDSNLIANFDRIVVIIAALVNLQSSLIR